jgi:pyruvate/2-oxoglutarate dehydrogenase complex dihydrolipoamide acyltransferase (E2) component
MRHRESSYVVCASPEEHDRVDQGAQGTLLVELESFKAVIEIRAAQDAFLRKILVSEGESQALGKPIAVFSDTLDEPMPRSFATLQEMSVEYLFM